MEIYIEDDPTTPRREYALNENEFRAMEKASRKLSELNEGFDGTTRKNDEIAIEAAEYFRGLVGSSKVKKLVPKHEDESLQVYATMVREGVEVYFVYAKVGNSCDRVTLLDSKGADLYDAFVRPAWD